MTDESPQPKRTNIVPVIMAVAFAVIFFALVANGGQCERYNKKMERQEQLRKYYESLRR